MNNDNYANIITGTEIYYSTDTNAEIEMEIEIEANTDNHIKAEAETHISINIWLIFYNQIECDRLKLLSIEQLTSLFSLSISLQIK